MRRFGRRGSARRAKVSGFPRGCLALGAALVVAACSLSTNVDRLDDGACPAGTKPCDESCVSETEPSVGCSLPGCTPCDLPNAVVSCSPSGTCTFMTCMTGAYDCNKLASDGCEADIQHDPLNCGKCGCRCGSGDATDCLAGQDVDPIARGTPGCSAGLCVAGACVPGWGDCNGDAGDGCETPTNTSENCGTCGSGCDGSECVCTLQDGSTGCGCASRDGSAD